MMTSESLWTGGVQQAIFRELLEAFSRPGGVRDLSEWLAGTTAQRAVLATLMDGECTLADPHAIIAAEDWSLLQAHRATPETARFVTVDGKNGPNFQPAIGSLESPEFGATLLIKVDNIGAGVQSVTLSGPGIDGLHPLCLDGLHTDWLEHRANWNSSFPLGVDMLLFDARHIVALPRTTHVAITSGAI